MRARALLVAATLLPSAAMAQSFSCGFGDTPACLGYGDKVCSSRGKCVDESAACFDSYQCNYEGFTCKSNLTECGDVYDRLLVKHNSLVDDYNELLESSRNLRADLEDTQDDRDEFESRLIQTTSELEEAQAALNYVEDCVLMAGEIDDARECFP